MVAAQISGSKNGKPQFVFQYSSEYSTLFGADIIGVLGTLLCGAEL